MKDVSAPAAASGLPAEEIETKVALIKALNSLWLYTVSAALAADVVSLAVARYCRTGGHEGAVRCG